MQAEDNFLKGRGAQLNTKNHYLSNEYVAEHIEGLDEELITNTKTKFYKEFPKKIVNKVVSPDIPFNYSMNPYQGCEHGCIYCYARNTHQYWGYNAGLDFERKIIVKENAPEVLEKQLKSKNWKPAPIMFSGNTDCYQPIEREKQITRRMLQVLLKYKHPVGMITKNSLITRDIDILSELAKLNLVNVAISITTLDEAMRRKLEPRTSSAKNRLQTVQQLSSAGIPVFVMHAPIIPGINNHEIPAILKAAAESGATSAGYTMVRLNGQVEEIFTDWLHKTFPDRANKVLSQIAECHGGKVNDSNYGQRMKGVGNIALSIHQLFAMSKKKYFKDNKMPELVTSLFDNHSNHQMKLF
ncbi:MAG: PA0069 family radical SAM protein [Flavobacteriales bacterium]|nr:PA0069 family radical SAM protein [Flavobacteriales bacterium]